MDDKLYYGIPRGRFDPVCAVDKYVSFDSGKHIDPVVCSLVEKQFGDVPYNLVRPTYSSVLLDIAKYSGEWHFRRSTVHETVIKEMRREVSHLFMKPLDMLDVYAASERLNPTSSNGWPLNQKWPDKRSAIRGTESLLPADFPALTKRFLLRRMNVWSCNPKIEIRPRVKLEEFNIRTFLSGSLDENLASLMYFAPANDVLARGWRTIPYTWGMNNFDGGWNHINVRWPRHIAKCYSTDQSKYDGGFSPYGHFILPEVIYPFYSNYVPNDFPPVWNGMMSVAHSHASGPMVLPNGLVLWRYVGNPSGSGLTIQANSFAYRYDFADFCLTPRRDGGLGLSLEEFRQSVHQDVHGDDCIIGSTSSMAEDVHPNALSEFLIEQRGRDVKITAYNETPVRREECKYLSRVNKIYRGQYVPSFENPMKLVASLALNADADQPEGWSPEGYQLTRMNAICNELCFNEDVWFKVREVIDQYILIHDLSHRDDLSWCNAKKVAKGLRWLQDRYVQ